MSSNKVKNNTLSEEEFEKTKARIIYDRLKTYYDLANNDELGNRLAGIGKMAISKRRKKGKYDRDEIILAFPDVNEEWLDSNDLEDLKKLPVRSPEDSVKVQRADSVDTSKGEISHEAMKELLGQIESIVRILKDSL